MNEPSVDEDPQQPFIHDFCHYQSQHALATLLEDTKQHLDKAGQLA